MKKIKITTEGKEKVIDSNEHFSNKVIKNN